jgi:hypothetical protein
MSLAAPFSRTGTAAAGALHPIPAVTRSVPAAIVVELDCVRVVQGAAALRMGRRWWSCSGPYVGVAVFERGQSCDVLVTDLVGPPRAAGRPRRRWSACSRTPRRSGPGPASRAGPPVRPGMPGGWCPSCRGKSRGRAWREALLNGELFAHLSASAGSKPASRCRVWRCARARRTPAPEGPGDLGRDAADSTLSGPTQPGVQLFGEVVRPGAKFHGFGVVKAAA